MPAEQQLFTIESHGAIAGGDQLLQKPITARNLARAVRQALGEGSESA